MSQPKIAQRMKVAKPERQTATMAAINSVSRASSMHRERPAGAGVPPPGTASAAIVRKAAGRSGGFALDSAAGIAYRPA